MTTNTTINFAPQISSAEPALRLVEKIRRVLGNTICRFLEEPGIIEIMLNADGTLWIERLTAGMECIGTMQPSQAESVICSVAAFHKQNVTRESPIFEGELPLNGERFEALIPPVVSSPVFTIRHSECRFKPEDTTVLKLEMLGDLSMHDPPVVPHQ